MSNLIAQNGDRGFLLESRDLAGEPALMLLDLQRPDYDPLVVDFISGQMQHRLKNGLSKSQPLAKALGLKSFRAEGRGPMVFDATAGMGTDAFIMAAMGCRVRALERSPLIFALLQDGWRRLQHAAISPLASSGVLGGNEIDSRGRDRTGSEVESRVTSRDLSGLNARGLDLAAIAARLTFENANSLEVLEALARDGTSGVASDGALEFTSGAKSETVPETRPDIVYLDPMYPEEGRSRSALPKKEMQIFRRLLGDDHDADALLKLARAVARERVVVKRPLYAPVQGEAATHSFIGKTARFDMYLADSSRGADRAGTVRTRK